MDPNNPVSNPSLGNFPGSAGYNFPGIFDDVKVYNYERTPAQIIEDMNAGHPAPGSPVGSAVAHWKFDEGYGNTANDSGTGGNNGTVTNATWTNNGKYGKALNFVDDSFNRVDLGTDYSELAAEITVSAWVRRHRRQTAKAESSPALTDWDAVPANERGWTLGYDWGSTDVMQFDIGNLQEQHI